jgi:uncharacterized protein YjeT (DUF2065 family)
MAQWCCPSRLPRAWARWSSVVRYVAAAVLILVGLVFVGQGVGIVPGSFMTGQQFWALAGAVLIVAGAYLAWTARRSAKT